VFESTERESGSGGVLDGVRPGMNEDDAGTGKRSHSFIDPVIDTATPNLVANDYVGGSHLIRHSTL
jgi:hypothetical protein